MHLLPVAPLPSPVLLGGCAAKRPNPTPRASREAAARGPLPAAAQPLGLDRHAPALRDACLLPRRTERLPAVLRRAHGPRQAGAPPPMDGRALAAAAAFVDRFHREEVSHLLNALHGRYRGALFAPVASDWLRTVLLREQVTADDARRQLLDIVALLRRGPELAPSDAKWPLPAPPSAHPLAKLDFKLAERPALRRDIDLRPELRVREMFGRFGLYFVSNTLSHGGYGKFRMARDSRGALHAIKEFRSETAALYAAPDAQGAPAGEGKKTRVTPLVHIRCEMDNLRQLGGMRLTDTPDAPGGIRATGAMVWRGKFYLVMTLMKGPASDILGAMPPRPRQWAACVLARDVAAQLAVLHQQVGAVHRDVKLDNVLVDFEGRVFLSDFALATKFNAPQSYVSAHFAGTFFAPEQLQPGGQGMAYTPAADVFCLGASLLDVLLPYAKNPFRRRPAPNFRLLWHGLTYADYAAWHADVQGGDGDVVAARLELRGNNVFGRYFYQLHAQTHLATLLLDGPLHPDPSRRSDAAAIAARFAAALGDADAVRGRQLLRDAPLEATRQAAMEALAAYHAAHKRLRLFM